jgi:hypothetical protein
VPGSKKLPHKQRSYSSSPKRHKNLGD